MHIIKRKTKITNLSFEQVRTGVGKLRPEKMFCAARKSLKQIIERIF